MLPAKKNFRKKLYDIIFESESFAGKLFDISLLILIVISMIIIMLETIPGVEKAWSHLLFRIDMFITIIFTIEYVLRLYSSEKPWNYAKSFYGIIDLFAILPVWVGLIFPEAHFLLVIRIFRLLRVFRIFKMIHFLEESSFMMNALWQSRRKIFVFFFFVILITTIAGVFMFVIESPFNDGFSTIPQSIYWAIVTLTTVGYGDISPITPIGKVIASLIMLLGYCIIAVPTGIISANLARELKSHDANTETCPHCFKQGHDKNAAYCKFCGHHLGNHAK